MIIRFDATSTTSAPLLRTYDVLADIATHLVWAGEQAPTKAFRLLTLDAPTTPAVVGTQFTSTGDNGNGTFHDVSVVTEASAPSTFAFTTTSRLERTRGAALDSRFTHRFVLEPDGLGTRITYTCELVEASYRPYWLHPLLKPMTRSMVNRRITRHLENLAALAASASTSTSDGASAASSSTRR